MADARDRLLRAAEEIFSTKGIDGTSIREVNALAGQRNTSAIRYHFNGMTGLLETLIEMRMSALDLARERALDRLDSEQSADAIGVDDYVSVLVRPLADRVHEDPGWACWVRVLGQLVSVRGAEHRPLWEGRFDRTARLVFSRIRPLLPEMPGPVWEQRVEDLMLLCVGSLCERASKLAARDRSVSLGAAAFTSNLISVGAAGLRAPVPSVDRA